MPAGRPTERKTTSKRKDTEAVGDQAAVARNGQVLSKLGAPAKCAEANGDDDYWHQVSQEHSDFANWVRDVFKR